MDLPVRHVLLRDDLHWIGTPARLAIAADGTLSLVRVPAPGTPLIRDTFGDAEPSGIAATACDEVFIAETSARRLVCIGCGLRYETPLDAVPAGMALQGDSLYMADRAHGRVLCLRLPRLELRRVVEGGLTEPTGVAVDSAGWLYVLDRATKRVLRFDARGAADTSYAPAATEPLFLALDANDRLYVSDASAEAVLIFDTSGTKAGEISSAGMRPRALAVHGEQILVADAATGRLLVHDTSTGALLGSVPDFRASVAAMTFDPRGNLFIKFDGGAEFVKLAADAGCIATGTLTAGPFDAGELNDWERVHLDSHDALVTLDTYTGARRLPAPALTDWIRSPSAACLLAREQGPAPDAPATRRFLWLRVTLQSADGRASPMLKQVHARTNGESYLERLPRIYRRDDQDSRFLERWLTLFRSALEEREQARELVSQRFDPATVSADHVAWLADAVAFDLPQALTPAQARALLARIPQLYARRGTLAGLEAMVEIYSGIRPRIIEAFHARRVWQLGETSLLGFDTALAAATPEGLVVPHDARTDPAYAGLRGDYYEGTDFQELIRSETNSAINFDQLFLANHAGERVSPYTVRWSGQLRPRFSESYQLKVEAAAGVRLWIDGQLLIDTWTRVGQHENPRAVLDASRWHAIRLEVRSLQVTSTVRFSWSSRRQKPEVVPRECLYCVLDEHADLSDAKPSAFDVGRAVVGEGAPIPASDFGIGLFAEYAHLFTVLAPAGSCRDAAGRAALRDIIEREKPAHSDYHLCFVEPRMRVGFQARLGIDAIVANGPPPMRLDGAQLDRDSYLEDAAPGGARVAARARLGQDTVVG
jgi:phage tail-like protein